MQSRLAISGNIGGVSFNSTATREASGEMAHELTLAAAKAGTLSTRTNNTQGVLTLGAGHGIVNADTIDIYWDGGRRYDVTVSGVVGNDVTFAAGLGDNLPVVTTPVTAMKVVNIDIDFVANLVDAIGTSCAARGRIGFYAAGGIELFVDLIANELWHWLDGVAANVNPMAGDTIVNARVTQAGTTEALFKLGLIYNSA